jgi:hypothetical protein
LGNYFTARFARVAEGIFLSFCFLLRGHKAKNQPALSGKFGVVPYCFLLPVIKQTKGVKIQPTTAKAQSYPQITQIYAD